MGEPDGRSLSPAANDSWRMWLMTGSRRAPTDRRRVRGSHKGLKKMLVEGMRTGGEQPYSWKEFSDAMVRQSVGEAIRNLPIHEQQMVKLAYFGGLSNRQIAMRFDMTESAVQRHLRQALTKISAYVERGRSLGRRVVCALGLWLAGRRFGDATHHLLQAGAVIGAAAVIAVQPAPVPAQVHSNPGAAPSVLTVALPGAVQATGLHPKSAATAGPAATGPATGAVQAASLPQTVLQAVNETALSLPALKAPIAAPSVPAAPLKLKPPV